MPIVFSNFHVQTNSSARGIISSPADQSPGGEYESRTPKDILIKYAREPNFAPHFNHASMAHNNHFFFKCLSPRPTEMPGPLAKELEESFSSVATLRREFVVTANAMFGPGFVWLVKDRKLRKYSLLTTFLAGSPYAGAHHRKQTVDMNTTAAEPSNISEAMRREIGGAHRNQVGAFGPLSEKQKPPGGLDVVPVLCLNVWEHVYLPDYGVGLGGVGGKEEYVKNWWESVDWLVVANNADVKGPAAFKI
jgi:Fe-Mn family superoxide dismutase